jgi:hypothetical protein
LDIFRKDLDLQKFTRVAQKVIPHIPVRVTMFVRTWLREQQTSWYREGMHSLVSRWRKAVDVDGDYVEK